MTAIVSIRPKCSHRRVFVLRNIFKTCANFATLIAWYNPPNSRIAPKPIGEGASSLFGEWPGSPENVSCSRATPDLHRCNLFACSRARDIFGTPGPFPKKTTCSFSYRFRGNPGIRGVVPGNQGRNANSQAHNQKTQPSKPL